VKMQIDPDADNCVTAAFGTVPPATKVQIRRIRRRTTTRKDRREPRRPRPRRRHHTTTPQPAPPTRHGQR
jgi:hypothetical protein